MLYTHYLLTTHYLPMMTISPHMLATQLQLVINTHTINADTPMYIKDTVKIAKIVLDKYHQENPNTINVSDLPF